MAMVYVWPSRLSHKRPGHASLEILSSGVYISFWPKESNKSKVTGKTFFLNQVAYKKEFVIGKLKDDLSLENYDQPRKYYIDSNKIDTDKMEKWWNKFQGQYQYHFIRKNCCDVVLEALEAGGAYDWVTPWKAIIRTPYGVSIYARRLAAATEKRRGYDYWYVAKMICGDGLLELSGL